MSRIPSKLAPMLQANHQRLRRPVQLGLIAWALAAAIVCSGCGKGDPCSLRGVVNFNGELLPEGDIRLDPVNNPDAARAAAHIEAGKFEIARSAGMLAGTYRVAVYAVRPTGRKVLSREALNGRKIERIVEEEQYIPERYNRRSKLHIELSPGENEQEIELEE
ncbi:hypothetical protein OAS39_06500 [Pirellulales bacterium]|nr:hypothetical protein [Pirellulales bacterium]